MKLTPGRIPAPAYIFVSALALFLFSLQRNFSAAHDSITYLNHIVAGKNLFHPHHLLYNLVARGWLLAGQAMLPLVKDYFIIESLSAVFGSGILTLCYLFMTRRLQLPSAYTSVVIAVIAFSYGVWSYSSNIEVYAPALFFAILVLYRITNSAAGRKYHLVTAIYLACAILFHQVHVLLFFVAIIHLYRRLPTDQFSFLFWPFTLIVLGIAGIAYLVAAFGFAGVHDVPGFFNWATLYAHGHNYWRSPGFSSIILVLVGFLHSIIGAQFVFNLPFPSIMTQRAFLGHKLSDEKFLVHTMASWQSVLLLVLTIMILCTLIYLVWQLKPGWLKRQPVLRPLVTSFLVYSVFFVFWMPENLEFWIFQSILAWIILLSSLYRSARKKVPLVLAGTLAATLFIVNYSGSIFWLQDQQHDWYYSRVSPLIPTGTRKDLVICKEPWILSDYVARFTECQQPVGQGRNQMLNAMNTTLKAKGRVFIFSEQDPNRLIHSEVDMILFSVSERLKVFSREEPPIYLVE